MKPLSLPLKIYLLFTISVITAADAFTQTPEFAPVGAKWWYAELYYDSWADTTPDQGFLLIESVGDTIIEGVNCKKLQFTRTTFENETYPFFNRFIYQDNLKIYTWIDSAFYLIYDFSGEDFKIPNPDPWSENDTTLIVIDSIGLIELSGFEFKYFNIHDEPFGFGYGDVSIIEYIGSTGYLLPIEYTSTFLFLRTVGLSCYEDALVFYKSVDYACDTTFIVPTNINEIMQDISYNYFDNILLLNSDYSFDLALYSINGQQVFELQNILHVAEDLGTLPKGIYLIKINLKGNLYLIKIAVI